MALSTRKKNIIIADWKTGAYSLNSLAKKHKISTNTVKKICKDISHDNAQLVEACTIVEGAKKCTKNAQELKAIDEVVANRLKVQTISTKLLDKIEGLLDGGKAQKVVTLSSKEDGNSAEIVEYDLQSDDYKKLADAVDKVSVTTGVNERFSNSQVNIQNNNSNSLETTGITIRFMDED